MQADKYKPESEGVVKFKFVYTILKQKTDAILILAIAAITFALSLFFVENSNHNHFMMYSFAHKYAWSLLFVSYGLMKLYSLFAYLDFKLKVANAAVGLWAWNYVFLSFVVFDSNPMMPEEILFALPIVIQSWILMSLTKKE
jgi:hypothetical protein